MELIKEMIGKLDKKQLLQLEYALEEDTTSYIVIEGRFIGVNCTDSPQLIIESIHGAWSTGVVKCPMNF